MKNKIKNRKENLTIVNDSNLYEEEKHPNEFKLLEEETKKNLDQPNKNMILDTIGNEIFSEPSNLEVLNQINKITNEEEKNIEVSEDTLENNENTLENNENTLENNEDNVEKPEQYSLDERLANSPLEELKYMKEIIEIIFNQEKPIPITKKMWFFKKRKAIKFNKELERRLDELYLINYQNYLNSKEDYKVKIEDYMKEQKKYRDSLFKL